MYVKIRIAIFLENQYLNSDYDESQRTSFKSIDDYDRSTTMSKFVNSKKQVKE